ncbi:hypothetical protein H1R20_g10326, partial [Candolleomyces eurysporus]
MAPIEKQLVVFDFDWSMADQDTDRWVFEVLAPDLRRKMKTLKEEIQWTDLVAQSLRELNRRGIKREQIESALRVMPFHPAMVRGVDNLKKAGRTTFLCLSNANSVYISTILEDKKLTHIFSEVVTNPAHWEGELLSLRRRVDPSGPQHGCTVGCSVNMCKGAELQAFLAKNGQEYDRIVYVGDGTNDFCPILRMRDHRGLSQRISKEGKEKGLKPKIKYWGGAWEVEEIFNTL